MESHIDELAALLAGVGRDIIMPAFTGSQQVSTKADGSVVTAVDVECQRLIHQRLQAMAPAIDFLGEEMESSAQLACLHAGRGRYWCLDPLDGTSNFVAGIPVFATSLALIEGGRPRLAVIHDPVRGETFTAVAGRGAARNGELMLAASLQTPGEAVGYIDFKRLDRTRATHFATEKLYRSQRNIGTCALEWAWLAAGRGHFIIHGGEKLWDFAAGSLLATEAGCTVGDFSGRPLFPAAELSSPILAACSETLARALRPHLRQA